MKAQPPIIGLANQIKELDAHTFVVEEAELW